MATTVSVASATTLRLLEFEFAMNSSSVELSKAAPKGWLPTDTERAAGAFEAAGGIVPASDGEIPLSVPDSPRPDGECPSAAEDQAAKTITSAMATLPEAHRPRVSATYPRTGGAF